jgi:hypothetical protein
MIYFTIIGTRDSFVDIKDPFKTCGAALTIFMNYREDIDTVYLFTTKTGVERDQLYKEAADITEKLMKRQNKKLKFSQVELDFVPSPIDYMTVFHEMMAKIKTIMEEDNVLNIEDHKYNFWDAYDDCMLDTSKASRYTPQFNTGTIVFQGDPAKARESR